MDRIIVAGIGTDVGKTVVSAILAHQLSADYWKPVECGGSDSQTIRELIGSRVHPPAYSFKAPLSPHAAARLENKEIGTIAIPATKKPLIIEGVGGIFVPLTNSLLSIDLFKTWPAKWIIVSRHYLGSINHTLLTLHALKMLNILVHGIVFNGEPNLDSESAILDKIQPAFCERLFPEAHINSTIIKKYGEQWSKLF